MFLHFPEYEGSPRRIGQMGSNSNDDEHLARVNNKLSQNLTTTTASTAATSAKTNHHNVLAMTSTAGAITTTAAATNATATLNSPKQQQHYTARPGFPQVRKYRVIPEENFLGTLLKT